MKKRSISLILAVIYILAAVCQVWAAAPPAYSPKMQFFDTNGNPLSGGKIYTYIPGISTLKTTYTDSALTTPATNPVVLDSYGQVTLYLASDTDFILKTASGSTLWGPITVRRDWATSNILYAGNDLAAAVAAAGATSRTILLDQAVSLTADLIVPTNVKLWIIKGGSVSIPTTKTLTINGPLDAGLYQVFTCTGTGQVVLGTGSVTKVYPEWWGENTTPGTTDMTAEVQAATNAAGGRAPVVFSSSNYLITDTLAITANSYKWMGLRTEKGCNAMGQTVTYSAVKITFSPVDTAKYLVSKFSGDAPYSNVWGPYEHKDLTFVLGDANGFEFGRRSLGSTNQKYTFGVQFKGCALTATLANPDGSATGAFTRSGKYIMRLARAFETIFEDVSLLGGDTQVECYACDKPIFSKIRTQYSHVPFDFIGASSYTVQHTIDNLQCEGWTFTPIKSFEVKLSVSNSSFEDNIGVTPGHGIYTLTDGQAIPANVTVAITENSNSLTFSQSMDNILFPDLSIIRVYNGTIAAATEQIDLLVSTVSGTTVTVYANATGTEDTYCTSIPFTHATGEVQRIHGYGPIHFSAYPAALTNVTLNPWQDCPGVVYVPNRGAMSVFGGMFAYGNSSSPNAMVLGNRLKEPPYLASKLNFVGCSQLVIGDPNNPFISVDNWGQNRQANYPVNYRGQAPNQFAEMSRIKRVWTFTPKGGSASTNNSHRVVFQQYSRDTYGDTAAATSERIWAWNIRAGETLILTDPSLPAHIGWFRVLITGRSATATPVTATITTQGDGSLATFSPVFTAGWNTFEYFIQTPIYWRDTPNLDRGFRVTNTGIHLAGIVVEELVGMDAKNIRAGFTTAPTTGTWEQGQIAWRTPAIGSPAGWVCLASGTFGAATDNTGDTTNGSAVIAGMTDTSDFYCGEYVTVSAGMPSAAVPYKIVAKTATSITLDTAATSTQANVTVATPDPTFAALPNL